MKTCDADSRLGSVQEVKSLLYIIADREMANTEKVKSIQDQCGHCQALILALVKHIRNSLDGNSNKTNESEVYY